ncbi:RNA polymerase sigma-70 factor [Sphingobacterium psychroaquaticum]|uniref:RNA polymerase sigma-70 factor n=1 Tax=Sphingobacterium psychroaquaticum TaxID=561061 RepID=UPI00106D06C6|nr:RNA polymerase sigma-70 factor [Sphingobacterium psychroaquaticum]QBQ42075.1 RNA polymerase sigma-70 factor [Sphingobacterium psychroaquaticum]
MRTQREEFEKKWIASIRIGDKEIFGEIYDHYWKRLLAISFQHTKDKELAEEIVQDVFVSVWQRRQDVQIDNLDRYLATAVKFSTFKFLQRRRRQELIREEVLPHDQMQLDEEAIDARFLQEYVNGVVETLPDRCRLVFQLSRSEQMTHREIADTLDISEKAVEANITRALKVLRVSLRKVGFTFLAFLFF